MDHGKKFQQWIDAALSRRAASGSAEAAFYGHLIEGEQGSCPWQQAGYATFDDVLRKFQLADVLRYRRLYSATLTFGGKGLKLAQKLGIDAVIVGSGIADEEQRTMFVRKLEELTAKRPHSAPLTLEEMRHIRKDIAPRAARPRTDKPKSIGLPESVRLDLEQLVLELRKGGGSAHASALVVQFIRDGITRCRSEMAAKSSKGAGRSAGSGARSNANGSTRAVLRPM